MAVRAQYPANAFSPDFRYRARSGALDDPLMMQEPRDLLQLHGNNLGTGEQQHQILNNAGVFSDRQSELTCNASGCRKRSREEAMVLPGLHNPALSTLFRYPNATAVPVKPTAAQTFSVGLPHSRSIESGATSTSGRHVSSSHAAPPPPCDLVSLLFQQNTEIDALVRLQNERLPTGLEEARKRHCRALLTVLEQQVAKRLMEKEAELLMATRRNAELEEKVRQLSEEIQIWFAMAKNNETIVCNLRTNLEQVLLQGASGAAGRGGYDDSEGGGFPADDAQSCCFEFDAAAAPAADSEVATWRRACKACGERDVSILLLPCRHLCLCKDCEAKADACPVCGSAKNAYLQVFMC
uniref:RING-type domain-containing protein n=1 Tax=Musa acuminata subsp. malaccensis TaxID=214687 RepID=A0A804KX99_MUSAM|nr:PREDICTED: BOI-related E3 ubiquitin-protein ligase 1-like [Musa acuminata subsp. malaccensis]